MKSKAREENIYMFLREPEIKNDLKLYIKRIYCISENTDPEQPLLSMF